MQLKKKNHILEFIRNGKALEGIKIGDSTDTVFDHLGKPSSIVGDCDSGFYIYKNGLRFRYVDNYIDELGVMFYGRKNMKFPVKIELLEENTISETTTIYNFLKIISSYKIKWRSWDEHSTDVFSIRTEGDVLILFDLEDGKLDRIVYIGDRG